MKCVDGKFFVCLRSIVLWYACRFVIRLKALFKDLNVSNCLSEKSVLRHRCVRYCCLKDPITQTQELFISLLLLFGGFGGSAS